jgi:hypothetical protein
MTQPLKHCARCGKAKPLPDFNKDASRADGLRGTCKPCRSIADKAWRLANPEHMLRKSAAQYFTRDKGLKNKDIPPGLVEVKVMLNKVTQLITDIKKGQNES